jgi:isoleucyl-tRNA synthetase
VFFHAWYVLPEQANEAPLISRWEQIRAYRANVLKELENARSAGQIGSSLQAEVILHAKPETHALLASLGDDLKFVLITSRAELVTSDEDKVIVVASGHAKCERCWHYREDVGSDTKHSQLCGRCISNLFGKGEAREHA